MSELFKWDRGAKLFLHDLLGEHHEDTLTGAVAAGDLLHGNSTQKWARLVKGTQGQVLRMGSSLPGWSSEDGWIDCGAETWVYNSASSFYIAGADLTAKYQKGTLLKYTQTTVKYGVVASVIYSAPNTVVSIIINTDYTVANAAISANYISYQTHPQGWPGWFSYAPTLAGWSVNPSNTMYKYQPIGNRMRVNIRENVAGTSSAATTSYTAPVTSASVTYGIWLGSAAIMDNSVLQATPGILSINTGVNVIRLYKDFAWTAPTASGSKYVVAGFIEYEW